VTAMVVAGSRFGADLLWVNFLSCLFSWACVEAYDRIYLATGETALWGIKNHLPFGKTLAWLIIIGLSFGQYNSLMGNLSTTSNAIFETFNLFFPSLQGHAYGIILSVAIVNVGFMYFILNIGKYSLFEKILTVFVVVLSFSFIISLFIAPPSPIATLIGFLVHIPNAEGANRLIVAIVGTTMAAATFITRPLFLQASGWTKVDKKIQSKDAIMANVGLFVIGTTIMLIAMETLHREGKTVEKVLDMVGTLEPIAGRFAVVLFLTGTLSAGLCAIFPMLMITPMMLSDYQQGKFEMGSKQFKILTAVAAAIGLIGPLLGKNPIEVQIFSQVFLVLILPLVVLTIILLVNNGTIMKDLKAGVFLNVCLGLSFVFSVLVTYYGIVEIKETFAAWMK